MAVEDSKTRRSLRLLPEWVLGGPMAEAELELERALDWSLKDALDRAGVTEVRFSKDADRKWQNELGRSTQA
jgi:hypothetical protein